MQRLVRARWLAAVLLLLWAGACATPPPPPSAPPADPFKQGQRLFLDGQFAAAAGQFEEVIKSSPRSPDIADACYWAGRCYLKTGDYARAEKSFREALRKSRASDQRSLAEMGLADSLFMQQRYSDASQRYGALWKSRDQEAVAGDLLLLRLGQCEERQGHSDKAREWLAKLKEMYPDSIYVSRGSPRPSPGPGGQGEEHYVQLGVFSTEQAAAKQADGLRAKQIDVYIVKEPRFYSVRTGRFASLAEAQREAARLKAKGIDAVAK